MFGDNLNKVFNLGHTTIYLFKKLMALNLDHSFFCEVDYSFLVIGEADFIARGHFSPSGQRQLDQFCLQI